MIRQKFISVLTFEKVQNIYNCQSPQTRAFGRRLFYGIMIVIFCITTDTIPTQISFLGIKFSPAQAGSMTAWLVLFICLLLFNYCYLTIGDLFDQIEENAKGDNNNEKWKALRYISDSPISFYSERLFVLFRPFVMFIVLIIILII